MTSSRHLLRYAAALASAVCLCSLATLSGQQPATLFEGARLIPAGGRPVMRFRTDGHWTSLAHRIVAAEVATALERNQ